MSTVVLSSVSTLSYLTFVSTLLSPPLSYVKFSVAHPKQGVSSHPFWS